MPLTTTSVPSHELGSLLHSLSWTIHRILPSAAGLDPLPTSELVVLMRVHREPGLTVSELALQLGLRQSNASAAVKALADRGLVERRTSPTDRRLALLHPSEKAQKNKRLIEEAWSGSISTALLKLPAEQIQAIVGAAEALAALEEELRTELANAH
ncbi:MarR family winged helix-turn-helix transcriptional regulator [Crystallibacter degradans]|uniref:MarR family winged helix-turn-helix transcriptional regulator n=1 Tax=Crystallibacter degradans TaxID=2726743 RepID=UPI001472C165|nr:MarR family transcriptional regulator [Arthrobacter sp. SF27]NMR29421.1 MarR family transcriptional regulator [Arthrobacter sp. SF27]